MLTQAWALKRGAITVVLSVLMITVTSPLNKREEKLWCKSELQTASAVWIQCDPLPLGILSTVHQATWAGGGGVRT